MMATTKSYMMARRATANKYRFLSTDTAVHATHAHHHAFEFDESDLWGGGVSTQTNSTGFRTPPQSIRQSRKAMTAPTRKCSGGEAASLPVNVPDWSKILRDEYKDKWSAAANFDGGDGDLDGGDDGEDDEWVPPHEYLAKTRNSSFSVQEGIGRTLKGRDLSRVRNAIWEKTGFQD